MTSNFRHSNRGSNHSWHSNWHNFGCTTASDSVISGSTYLTKILLRSEVLHAG